MKLMRPSVPTPACLVESEVDGSEQRTASRMSQHQVQY